MKKSTVTRELANLYPPWSRVRQSEQSNGFLLLNALAQPMDRMEKELLKAKANYFLTSANLDEVDLLYRLDLPITWDFSLDYSDPLNPSSAEPTVSGLIDSTWHSISLAEENSLQSFWYDAVPNRITLTSTVNGTDTDDLLTFAASGSPQSVDLDHHLDGGDLFVECTGGTRYVTLTNGVLIRGRVLVTGTTRKGTEETETFIFPWDMKQKSKKEWANITEVTALDVEDAVVVEVRSGDFDQPPYISPWNTRHSENGNKIDEFWGLGTVSGLSPGTSLDLTLYTTDEWQQLVNGFVEFDVIDRWELVTSTMGAVSGVDMALQPFSTYAWVATSDSKLYCYDTSETTVSGVSLLKDMTVGSHVQIEVERPSVVINEEISFMPWHPRPIKEIDMWRIWYQTPSGTKYGLLNGSPVSYTSDFWATTGDTITRDISNLITIPANERGEYLIVLEAIYIDGEQHNYRVIVPVQSKTPLAAFDLSSLISEAPTGIDFDADQVLWIKGSTKYYKIGLHYDTMLIDYEQKSIYFREPYEEVGVENND